MEKERYEKAKKILEKYQQLYILEELEKRDNKEDLIEEILSIDFEQLQKLYEQTKKMPEINNEKIENISYVDGNTLREDEKQEYEKMGNKIISEGKYAVVTMAGGQGTRLGHKGPKGTFLMEVEPQPKYLFEIIVDTLKRNNEKYHTILPWYIMTSKENHVDTVQFLEEKSYFGYPKQAVTFFMQGEMPLIDRQGKLLLDEKGKIKKASDGNGSIYRAMEKEGIIEDMRKKQIEWVYICSVDNVLLQIVEPVLLGLTISQGNEIGSKSIVKNNAKERVGAFCKRRGRPSVIEYSELPEEMAQMRDEKGELIFGEAHIMCNLYTVDAIEKIAKQKLPYHKAFKKIAYYQNGEYIEPKEENAYKFEEFIFDGFAFFDDMTIMRGKREEDFAPVKNEKGVDSPQTAIKLYNQYWKLKKEL